MDIRSRDIDGPIMSSYLNQPTQRLAISRDKKLLVCMDDVQSLGAPEMVLW